MQVFLPLIRKSDRKKCTTQQRSHWMNIFILIHILIICNNILIINILRLYHCLLTHLVNFSWLYILRYHIGTALVIQWLSLHLPVKGTWVQSLEEEQRSHMPQGQKNQNIKQKQYCNKVNKDFKNGPHLKILKRKKKGFSTAMFSWSSLQTRKTHYLVSLMVTGIEGWWSVSKLFKERSFRVDTETCPQAGLLWMLK